MSYQTYRQAQACGIAIVEGCVGVSAEQLVADGFSPREAKDLTRLARTYFARCAFSAMQRKARATTHTLAMLKEVERFVARIKGQRARWQLRVQLLECTTFEQMDATAKKVIEAHDTGPKEGVRIRRRGQRPWTLSITGRGELIADMWSLITDTDPETAVRNAAARFFAEHHTTPGTTSTSGANTTAAHASPAANTTAAHASAGANTGADAGVWDRPRRVAQVVVYLDELVKIHQGRGDEVMLEMTNGACITGREFLEQKLEGFATLIHPVEGPVNLYRWSRHASWKQAMMARAEQPRCAHPKCNHPADECQIHHIRAWSQGGQTNQENLTVLCPYHNGLNDDDPARPRNGRAQRTTGGFTWVYPPRTGTPPRNTPPN